MSSADHTFYFNQYLIYNGEKLETQDRITKNELVQRRTVLGKKRITRLMVQFIAILVKRYISSIFIQSK